MNDAETVKSKIDIVEFISTYISLKKAGRNFKACCPFHNEKTPSFVVSPERQTWHCFGACAEGGDVIKFLEKWENLDFMEALETLAKRTGVVLTRTIPTDDSRFKDKLYEINHLASEFFHYILISHKLGGKARIYLKDRKIKDEIINTFMLGYSPASWDSLSKFLVKKGYEEKDIYTAGLLVKSQGGRYYDRFRGRLMFTLKDHRGNTVGFSGRILPPEDDKEAKYINTSDTPVYTKGNVLYGMDVTRESIKKAREAVVVEGEFDMLASFQSGVTNVVAIKGSALTEGQVLLLKRYTENLVLALDSDFAGNEAARRGIDIAEGANLSVKVIKLPFGKDPFECISHDAYLWKKAVKDSMPIYDFIIDNAFSKYQDEGVIGKKRIGDEVLPYITRINNPIVLSHYIKDLAKRLEVTEESIDLSMRQLKKEKKLTPVKQEEKQNVSRQVLVESYFLSLLIQGEDIRRSMKLVSGELNVDDFDEPAIGKIFSKLGDYPENHQEFKVEDFVKLLPPEVVPQFDKAFLTDMESIIRDDLKYEEELVNTAREIKKLSLRRKIQRLTTKIRQLEEGNKEMEFKTASEELGRLIKTLNLVDKSA